MTKPPSLKIGLVFDDSLDSSDGVAQYVKTLGQWLSGQGHEARYLVGETVLSEWQGGKVYSLAKNQKVKFNGNALSIPLPANKTRIRKIMTDEEFDLLHVMMPYSPFMAQRVIDAANTNVAVVGTFHIFPAGGLSKLGGKLLSSWYGRKINRISPIVSVSPAAQDYALQTFGLNTRVVPNPVDVLRFASNKSKNKDKDIVFLGRLVKRKGCEQLILAFNQLSKLMPEVCLIIAGDGPQKKHLEKLSKRLGLADKVKFLGFIDEAEKPQLLSSAKLACFPSMYGESFGIVLIEAMASGSQVVLGGNNPGYQSVLAEQPLLLINPRDTNQFAKRLELLLSDKTRINQLHKWQLATVKQYDINIVGQQILDLYNGQIARQAKTSNNKAHGKP